MHLPKALLLLSLATVATAQQRSSNVGLTANNMVATAGQICGVFDCAAHALSVASGGRLVVTAYGPAGSRYALFAGAAGVRCTPVRGVLNGLLLQSPHHTLHVGMIGATDPRLPCNQGHDSLPFAIPSRLPTGMSITIQSIGIDGVASMPAFSEPITISIR